MESSNLVAIFMTGLITGGLTCMAVQGGLLASTLAERHHEELKKHTQSHHLFPLLSFLVAKLVAYTVLGLLLGLLGSIFTLTIQTQVFLQLAVAVFMVGTALHILDVHPIFRYFALQPPKFISKSIRRASKSNDIFAPAILGACTIFIPCATTQAMMALAIGSANPLLGAAILFSYILGTTPIFFVLGYFAHALSQLFSEKFVKIAAISILLLAFYNINSALLLSGSTIDATSIAHEITCTISFCETIPPGKSSAVHEATITIGASGYTPNTITVKAGSHVKLNLSNIDSYNCAQAFTIPRLNVQKVIPAGQQSSVEFTAPPTPGKLAFTCSMGHFRGTIDVI